MQARPPSFGGIVLLYAPTREPRRAGRDQRRVQATRQQHAIRHVAHHLPVHGALERLAQLLLRDSHALGGVVVAPGLDVIAHELAAGAVVVMPRRKLRDIAADAHQRLHLRRHTQPAAAVVAPVQRTHAHRIARNEIALRGPVPQREREDTVEAVEPAGGAVHRIACGFAIQRIDHLAIGPTLERVRLRQLLLKLTVVVYLAVDRQHQRAVRRPQRLRTAGRVDDGQPFVHQDRALVDVHAAPVGATVTLALRQFQCQAPQRADIVAGLQAEDSEDRTHGETPLRIGLADVEKQKSPHFAVQAGRERSAWC